MADLETTLRISADDHATRREYLSFRRHLYAYQVAAGRIKPTDTVADVGCGFGYAVRMITEIADQVYAIDAADTALDSLEDLPKLTKIKAYADNIPLEDNSVDFVIAFQLIEHVNRETAARVLQEFRRILRPGGSFVATTPNSYWRLYEGQKPWNPYHEREYTAEQLAQLCKESLGDGWKVKSIAGVGDAAKIEKARVAPSPRKHYGVGLKSLAISAWRRLGPQRLGRWRAEGRKPPRESDVDAEWFILSDDAAAGIDLWIEYQKPSAAAKPGLS